jgi:5-methylcytosine-specific restriction endonuclease McrA
VSLALRFQVLRRDDFVCVHCGRRPPKVILHVDHVIPWSAGGRTQLENLRTTCSDCNLGKGATRLARPPAEGISTPARPGQAVEAQPAVEPG